NSIEELVQMALRDTEGVLSGYAAQLERAVEKHDRAALQQDRDRLQNEVLQASTLAGIVRDFPVIADGGEDKLAVAVGVLSLLARYGPEETSIYSRFRSKGWPHAAQMVDDSGGLPSGEVNITYQRLRGLLKMPAAALGCIYSRLVEEDIAEYDLHAARRRIDAYSVDPVSPPLKFWMTGWTIIIPAVFVLLFMFAETKHDGHVVERPGVQHTIEALVWVLIAAVAISIGLEWERRRRARAVMVDKLRYKLFLPQYGVPVLIGVYTAAMSHEMTAHLALQLDDGRFIALGAGLFAAAAWALWRMIRSDKYQITQRSVLIAAARLFSYGFVIAVLLNLMLGPLLHYQSEVHHLFVRWITKPGAALHPYLTIPMKIPMELTTMPLFPRHIVLDALFGMFASIVLKKFLKADEEH
ncbi:MAG TPA: hypothetical protein VFV49_00195, partial [Thermoanaerobaculia bacterium]|nr:hypothetical protein [Thermoanaerobaculia bacterium]